MDDDYIRVKKTTPYYNLLKTISFPSLKEIVVGIHIISLFGGCVSYLLAGNDFNVLTGAIIGLFGLAIPSVISELVVSKTFLKDEPIFKIRRLLAFSLFSTILWASCILLGSLVFSNFKSFNFPSDAFFIWLFLILPIRFLVISSVTSSTYVNRFISSFFSPLISMVAFSLFLFISPFKAAIGFFVAAGIGYLYSAWLLRFIERMGQKRIGFSPIQLFRGILCTLLEKDNRALESILYDLGVERNLDIVTLGFKKIQDKKIKSAIVVSNFHPGPFMNVGSSCLPRRIIESVKRSFDFKVAVPHGISGHEMNLVSQSENERVIQNILEMLNIEDGKKMASESVTVDYNGAHSTCQIFGGCPFITLTLSPNNMEDIPLETGLEINEYVKKYYEYAAVVDAHNCISKVTVLSKKDLSALKESAFKALDVSIKDIRKPMKLGVAEIGFNEYGPENGVGFGGGVVQVFEVGSQRSAFITFDSNNMMKGLREKILEISFRLGINESEVMTTDTHEVNGVIPAKLGYHPLGEKIDIKSLLLKIRSSIREAVENLEEVEVLHKHRSIKVKVFGLKLFRELTIVGYKIAGIIVSSLLPIIACSIFIFINLFI